MPPFTFLSHICRGLLPILYKIDRNPLWKVFLNIAGLYFSGIVTVSEFTLLLTGVYRFGFRSQRHRFRHCGEETKGSAEQNEKKQ